MLEDSSMYRHATSRRRTGFTLVEVLVVTAIIAILFGLVTAAVMRGFQTAEDARVQAEIQQLGIGIQAFKSQFNVTYIPSSITLKTRLADYLDTNPQDQADWA